MADRMLFIGWDEPARGREERAVETFNEAVGLYGRYQQEGRIEKFEARFLLPTGNGLQGYFELHGSAQQIDAIREDPDFQRHFADATLCVDGMRCCIGLTGQGIADQMAIYQEAMAKVPQTTG